MLTRRAISSMGLRWLNAAFVAAALVLLWLYVTRAAGSAVLSPRTMLAAALLYLYSHLFRVIRLSVLFIERQADNRKLASAHFLSIWVSALLPFRLGEIFRLIKLSEVAGSWRHGTAAYVVEKFFDAAFLLALILSINGAGATSETLRSLLVILMAVVTVGVVIYWTGAGSIRYVARLLLTVGAWRDTLVLLRITDEIREALGAVRSTVHQRSLLLLVLTILIWALDFLAFQVTMTGTEKTLPDVVLALLAALEGTLVTNVGGEGRDYIMTVIATLSVVALPLIVIRGWRGGVARLLGRQSRAPYQLRLMRKRHSHG